jgi:diguanylate cyclase (GGDEF)-like protein
MKSLKALPAWYRQEKENLQFFKGNWRYILAWPVVGTVLAGALWGATVSHLGKEKIAVQKAATAEAVSLASVYAKQIERSIEKLDEITLYVKTDWERSNGTLKLEQLKEHGLFSTAHFASFLVVGPDGKAISSTIRQKGKTPISYRDREYFKFHKYDRSKELRVGTPTIGRLSGKRVIHLTRRLEHSDGSFAGVLVVGMPLDFFAPFSNESLFGKAGMLALIGDDGRVRVTGVGGEVNRVDQVSMLRVPDFSAKEWRDFASVGEWLPRTLDGDWFSDGQRRIAGTSSLKAYPFQTFVALSEQDVFAPYHEARSAVIRAGIVGTFILSFFVLAAMFLSARLVVRKAEEAEARKAYRIATEGGNEGFYLWKALRDPRGEIYDFRVIDCNERGAELYGRPKDDLLTETLRTLYPSRYADELVELHKMAFNRGFYEDDFKAPEDSHIRVEWINRKMVRTRDGLAITWRDVSQLRANEAEMARLATEDALTGLPNRYWMTKNLPDMLQRAGQNNSSLALLFIDLDDFKNVNDTLGHSAGDALLKAAATRLRSIVRPTDSVVRLGGDEFTVILDPVYARMQVEQVAARIVNAFKEPFELDQGSNFVGTSIGIGIYPEDGRDVETLTKNADIAMYSAKENKGGFRFYETKLYERFKNRLDMEQELQRALDSDQFVVHYQPRVNTKTGEIVGMEALVRWMHPVRGLVHPGDFIPTAESTGLILRLGALVMRKTCAQLSAWQLQGLPVVPTSINVSARQFNQSDVKGLIASCLEDAQLDAGLLEIELTESAMMEEGDEILAQLAEIDAMGIKLLVDDFGTGYSSLSLLQRLKLDVLKMDRAFTSQLGVSSEAEIFFRAIVSMAHALGMDVVAEGVESDAQLRILQSLDCDEVQGYFLSGPVTAEEVPAILRKRTLFPAQKRTVLEMEESVQKG